MKALAVVLLLLLASPLAGQEQKEENDGQRKLIVEMLQAVDHAAFEDPQDRARVCWFKSQSLRRLNDAEERELLWECLDVVQLADRETTNPRVGEQIAYRLLQLFPEREDEIFARAGWRLRRSVLLRRLQEAIGAKRFDEAIAMLPELGTGADYPWHAVERLIANVPDERAQLFLAALRAYQSMRPRPQAHLSDFASIVQKHWRNLPPELVAAAIVELLESAREEPAGNKTRILVSSKKSDRQFNSLVEFRSAQLLPILHKVDRSRAEKLQRDRGLLRGPGWEEDDPVQAVTFTTGDDKFAALAAAEADVNRHVNKLGTEAAGDPEQGLPAILKLSAEPQRDGLRSQRAEALLAMARACSRQGNRSSSCLNRASAELMRALEPLLPAGRIRYHWELARLRRALKQEGSVRIAVQAAAREAQKVYEDESGIRGNEAPVTNWASTVVWTQLALFVAQQSFDEAYRLAQSIEAPLPRTVVQLALGGRALELAEQDVSIVDRRGKELSMRMFP